MGFKFRKSIKILPGVKINLGKRSSSISVGTRGATVNFSSKGTRTTVGIPGTGISYTSYSKKNTNKQNYNNTQNQNLTSKDYIIRFIVLLIIFGIGYFLLTSCKNDKEEKALQKKIKQEICYPVNDEIDWCKDMPKVSMKGIGQLIDSNFRDFMKLKFTENDYTFHSGIENIKSKTDPHAKYAIVYIKQETFKLIPNTEKTFIMDSNFNGIKVIDGNIFKTKN